MHGYHLNGARILKPKKHKHKKNNQDVTKQLGNNDPFSTLMEINFTHNFFSKTLSLNLLMQNAPKWSDHFGMLPSTNLLVQI